MIFVLGSVCNLEQPADRGDAPSDGRQRGSGTPNHINSAVGVN